MRHSVQSKPIKVILCSNETDILFRISDQGGGMTKQVFANLWTYSNYKRFGNMAQIKQLEAKLNEHENMTMPMLNTGVEILIL